MRVNSKWKLFSFLINTFTFRPSLGQQVKSVYFLIVLNHIFLTPNQYQIWFVAWDGVVSERAWVTFFWIFRDDLLPRCRHVIHAADHHILHYSHFRIESAMDIDVPSLNAWSKVWSRREVLIEFKLDPPWIDLLVGRIHQFHFLSLNLLSLRGSLLHLILKKLNIFIYMDCNRNRCNISSLKYWN